MYRVVFAACWLSAATVSAQGLKLEPTELFLHHGDQVCQAVLAVLEPEAGETLKVQCDAGEVTYAADDLPRFMGRLVIPVPPAEAPQQVAVECVNTKHAGSLELPPARRWEIYIVPHTHLDVGFTNLQEKVWEELSENLVGVIELCNKTTDWPDEARFHWTIEGTALFENFAERHPDHVDALVKLIRAGRVELTAFWANMLTELCGPESLIRSLYSSRQLSDKYGLRIDTIMINDVPGYTWALPQLFTQIGLRYANLRANGIRGKFIFDRPGAVPRPFRWESPDGSRITCWYTDSYREANYLRRGFPTEPGAADDRTLQRMLYENLNNHLKRAAQSGYNHNALQLRMGGDNLTAVESVCQWVRYWNAKWAYPRLRIATSRQFFHALTNDSKPIPVARGDIPDWWADGAASSAQQTADCRIAHDKAVALETLFALPDGPAAKTETPPFPDIYRNLMLYSEHTWGASSHWYKDDMSVVEGQWKVKRGYVDNAIADVNAGEKTWEKAVGDWAKPAKDSIIVWNPSSWTRSDIVSVPVSDLPESFTLRHPQREESTPVQKDGDQWCFIAKSIPPMGYQLFEIETGQSVPSPKDPPPYEIIFDENKGVVTQIKHRLNGQELLEANPEFAFNQYVHETGIERKNIYPAQLESPRSPDFKKIELSKPAKVIDRVDGPVFQRIVTETSGPMAPSIKQSYTVYRGLDRLDISNIVEKTATETPEGIYFAFPFGFESPQCRLDIPFAIMCPGLEQLKYTATDFYSIYHFVEFAGDQGGVLWSAVEAPVVVFGDRWPECWTDDLSIDNGMLFSYAMTNYWFTNYRRQQGGTLRFRYAVQAYNGRPSKVRSYRFGQDSTNRMPAQVVRGDGGQMDPLRSWYKIKPENVAIIGMKRAENGQGWIVRLLELGVSDCVARLTWPKGETFWPLATDPTERNHRALASVVDEAGKPVAVRVALRKGELANIRLIPTPQE